MPTSPHKVYQFKVTLKGIRPPIWRRIQVPEDYTFWDLHVAIQDAMGWFDGHLHCFEMVNPRTGLYQEIGIPDKDFEDFGREVLDGRRTPISSYFTLENPKAIYTYDFGDDWEHEIKLEKIVPAKKGVSYPICLKGKMACPPEDCGGVWGYKDMLEVLSDPDHEEYAQTLEWLGEEFDPEDFDPQEVVFTDPEEHWEMMFGDQYDEEGENFNDEVASADDYIDEGLNRVAEIQLRLVFLRLLQRAKEGDLDGLKDEEKRIAQAMLEHEEEFFQPSEIVSLLERDFDPETDVNPFLHVLIHSAVEGQLAAKDPREAVDFYQARRERGYSHHDTIHLIGTILLPFMLKAMKEERPFEIKRYRSLLKKVKTCAPEEIPDLLDEEPELYPF